MALILIVLSPLSRASTSGTILTSPSRGRESLDGVEGAGKHHQRLPAPMELVVEIQTVDPCVAAPLVLVGSHANHSLSSQSRCATRGQRGHRGPPFRLQKAGP